MSDEPAVRAAPPTLNLHNLPHRRLRVTDLSELQHDLWSIREEMRRANDTYGDAAKDIPFAELAKQLKHFATKWDDSREKIQKSIDELHNTVKAVSETFGEVDRKMGLALRDPGAFDREMHETLLESGDYAAAARHKVEMDERERQRQSAQNGGE